MHIDTQTIRRLRDALMEGGRLDSGSPATSNSNASQASMSRVAPFVETMYLVMIADGDQDDDEKAVIRGAMRTLAGDLLDDASFDGLLAACGERLQEQGVEARLQAIGQRICADRVERETGFSLAAAVALADQQVAAEETELLTSIAEWYGVSSRRSHELLRQFDASS